VALGRLVPILPFEFRSTSAPPFAWSHDDLLNDKKPYRKRMDDMYKQLREAEDGKSTDAQEKKSLYETLEGKYKPDGSALALPQVLAGKTVRLSGHLELTETMIATLETLIEKAGGAVTPDDAYDILITRYRMGEDYLQAAAAQKTIGTIEWVYHIIKVGRLTSPLDELLHYPIPWNKIPEFAKLVRAFGSSSHVGGADQDRPSQCLSRTILVELEIISRN
jgi:hypothetical protein